VIYGIGMDLLRIERGERLWQRYGQQAVERMLHPEEAALFDPDNKPGRALARAFAAKEAFVKALGTGFRGVGYREVGAVREPDQRPRLVYSERMQQRLAELGIVRGHLSFSDDGGFIMAFVVLESA
jgi:holo-[acyl-carrier protein] synthase